ncbi:MAG TPA: glycosyltransferase family 4 protein [Gemmatimonadales bacterium]|nr:glycosyltransferase family 4 protein [Gemmatimonadales bacterium]
MMRVVHVVAPGIVGGLERVVQLLAQGQARAGYDVHVTGLVNPAAPDHPLLETLAASGVTTHPIGLPGRAYRQERAAMRELYRRLAPDVVHTHGYRPDVMDAAPARREGIPTVTTVHGFTGGDWKNRLYERLQRRAYRRAFDAVIVVSNALASRLIRDGVPADRIHILQNVWQETAPPLNPATARQLLGVAVDGFRLGWVGRLSPEKGADVLIDALPLLSDLPLGVSIVGEGAAVAQRSLLDRATRSGGGVGLRIRWHGLVPDASRLYKAFDVFVLSSRTEGTPIVLFEAMAAGVPIVATRVGGVPDVLTAAEALLVPSANPAALAAAIRAVYQDPAAARARAQRARERLLAEFTVPPWVDRYETVYRLVIRKTAVPV